MQPQPDEIAVTDLTQPSHNKIRIILIVYNVPTCLDYFGLLRHSMTKTGLGIPMPHVQIIMGYLPNWSGVDTYGQSTRNGSLRIWRANPQSRRRWSSWGSWQITAEGQREKTWCYAVTNTAFLEVEFAVIFPMQG
jgi:hypothetical protein